MSPRHVPATVTELSRIGLLSSLPGEKLNVLAARMQREDLAPGAAVVEQGEPGQRFYVVLSGLLQVTQDVRGERRLLRPGDYFGEVALAMDVPRTATVRPNRLVTPASRMIGSAALSRAPRARHPRAAATPLSPSRRSQGR
jgi:hypothetical protein